MSFTEVRGVFCRYQFVFSQIKFEFLIRHTHEGVEYTVGHTSLEFSGVSQTGDIN